jgi:hypothetical protein
MKALLRLVLFGMSLLACRNECDEAIDHWEECVGTDSTGIEIDSEQCSGRNECRAHCVTDAECLDLKKFGDPSSTFYQCALKC